MKLYHSFVCLWYGRQDLNLHGCPLEPKSNVSANSTTPAFIKLLDPLGGYVCQFPLFCSPILPRQAEVVNGESGEGCRRCKSQFSEQFRILQQRLLLEEKLAKISDF